MLYGAHPDFWVGAFFIFPLRSSLIFFCFASIPLISISSFKSLLRVVASYFCTVICCERSFK
ncbi:hypothetical protein AERO8C_50418 [Aeromonas veronii]|uniref:Uncharacterized protein n=1 Tax=Aeromonas veronii TaxID=654 RepID=A0A653L9W6_AERVE|nr:hypothetical protein AERO8C_50418 [Aeromonas veronii]